MYIEMSDWTRWPFLTIVYTWDDVKELDVGWYSGVPHDASTVSQERNVSYAIELQMVAENIYESCIIWNWLAYHYGTLRTCCLTSCVFTASVLTSCALRQWRVANRNSAVAVCRHDRRYALYTDNDVIWWRKARGCFGLSSLKVATKIDEASLKPSKIGVFSLFGEIEW